MPAGGLHGKLLTYIAEILRHFLESQGIGFLADTFMIYRDSYGIRHRVAPDFLIIPLREDPPSAYDLDMEPPPEAVVEITSPKSRVKDMGKKVSSYMGLGISAYLVIDAITPFSVPRKKIELHLWRNIRGTISRVGPDKDGYLPVPEMSMKIKAEGRNLILADIGTGEILKDSGELLRWGMKQKEWAHKEKQRADIAEKKAEQALLRAERLAEKLRSMGIDPNGL